MIKVTDLRGRLISIVLNKEKQRAGKYTYNFTEKVNGTYLLHFQMDNFKKVYRIYKVMILNQFSIYKFKNDTAISNFPTGVRSLIYDCILLP